MDGMPPVTPASPPAPGAPKPSPMDRFRNAGRPMQIGIGCGGVLLACIFLACIGGLISSAAGGGKSSASASTTNTSTLGSNATKAPVATKAPTATPAPKTWHNVQHFTGSENQQTATFHISNDQWRIVWADTVTGQYGGDFDLTLYQGDGSYVDLVANTSKTSGETYNAHTGTGDFYIKIGSLNTNYDVQVQVYS